MKKSVLVLILTGFGYLFMNGQSNIGIFIGGGWTEMRIKTDSIEFNKDFNKKELQLAYAYHGGFNFENVLVERKLYLMFGLQAKSSGYSAHHDSILFFIHNIHIPLEIKYKYFFSRRGESYLYASAGPYVAASYKGLNYNQIDIDTFLNDPYGFHQMSNPKIKFGKTINDNIEAIDYGINAGLGFGYDHFQIGYNFGLGLRNMIPSQFFEDYGPDEFRDKLKNMSHTLTVGFYFSNI
jgi:hypothetical protein